MWFFKLAQKCVNHLIEILPPRTFKNRPIWSHCCPPTTTTCILSLHLFIMLSSQRRRRKNFTLQKLLFLASILHPLLVLLSCFLKMGHSRPLILYFRLFNTQLTITKCSIIFCRWLDSNRGPLVSEATALPTEPHNHCCHVTHKLNLYWNFNHSYVGTIIYQISVV